MTARPSADVHRRLVSPDAWIRGDEPLVGDATGVRRLLLVLWHAVAASLPTGVPKQDFIVAVQRSARVSMRVQRESDGTYAVVLTDALLAALDAYTRAWVANDTPNALLSSHDSVEARANARDAALSMAWSYRHRGILRPRSLALTQDGAALAHAHAAAGLIFLMAHEVAHVTSGHLLGRLGAESCVAVVDLHEQETAADLLAASFLISDPLAITTAASSVRILFELLELLAFGVPDDGRTHPLAIRRMLAVLGVLDPAEHARLLHDLQCGRDGFWLLASAG